MSDNPCGATFGFSVQAERMRGLEVRIPVNEFGGYGPGGEVIYAKPLRGCPAVMVDKKGAHTLTVQSNGSTEFKTRLACGKEIMVLRGSFDAVTKRETGVPSHNLWLRMSGSRIASLVNPSSGGGLVAASSRVIKTSSPDRAMWFLHDFGAVRSAVKLQLVETSAGPAIFRGLRIENCGAAACSGQVWSCFNTYGTQFFAYNKESWYDSGLPVTPLECVVACPVPFSEIYQIRRASSRPHGMRPLGATCDYESFVGDSSASALFPSAVCEGRILPHGAGSRLNRFSTPTLAACGFDFELEPGAHATLEQSLLYITDPALIEAFRRMASCDSPIFPDVEAAFRAAAGFLVQSSPDVAGAFPTSANHRGNGRPARLETEPRSKINAHTGGTPVPPGRLVQFPSEMRPNPADCSPEFGECARPAPEEFSLNIPSAGEISEYANSLWATVDELYENCRAHGAALADGIEIGMRDRAQDMWAKVRQEPGRVREDLLHALSLMIVTGEEAPRVEAGRRMTLVEKLHGTFPRQYPSVWRDRSQPVANDNRPYADSPLWLLNALDRYITQTGDLDILGQEVASVRLLDPENPVHSPMVGHQKSFRVAEIVFEVFDNIRRSMDDSPYGMVQILYGDWCDPVDMFGTLEVGNPATRGLGRGVNTRLSAHAFETIVRLLDIFAIPALAALRENLRENLRLDPRIARAKESANLLRKNTILHAWEGDNFIDSIHEFRADGSAPDYASGELGYTFGSSTGRDSDGKARRIVTSNAYGLLMLQISRKNLDAPPDAEGMIARLLEQADALWNEKLGIPLVSYPVPNNPLALRCVGRMGMLPPGTAENGEYHHGQIFMHCFRSHVPGEAENAFRALAPVLSVKRADGSLGGPFDSPANSYASDPDDPHFGAGMNFGLSGSTAWLVEYFENLAGIEISLANPANQHVKIREEPTDFLGDLDYQRVIHRHCSPGDYEKIPLTISRRNGKVFLNGAECPPGSLHSIPFSL